MLSSRCRRDTGRDVSGRAGLVALEAAWEAARADRCLRLAAGRRPAETAPVPAAAGVAAAAAARAHPLQRAAAAGRSVAGQALDEVDVLMAGVVAPQAAQPPWLAAYAALQDRRLDRVTRHFGWRLLHGALRCGAASVHWCEAGDEAALWRVVCCPDPSCAAVGGCPA
jgi:hypothetical protein